MSGTHCHAILYSASNTVNIQFVVAKHDICPCLIKFAV